MSRDTFHYPDPKRPAGERQGIWHDQDALSKHVAKRKAKNKAARSARKRNRR